MCELNYRYLFERLEPFLSDRFTCSHVENLVKSFPRKGFFLLVGLKNESMKPCLFFPH